MMTITLSPFALTHSLLALAGLAGQGAVASPTPSELEARQLARCNAATFTRAPGWPSTARITYGPTLLASVAGQPRACYVQATLRPSSNSVTLGLVLPDRSVWNSAKRFLAVGNYGYAGAISTGDLQYAAALGFAAVSTDTGHPEEPNGVDFMWARNQDKLIDWSYRALNESIRVGKIMTEAFYSAAISKSYYSGCSTGGRQGLKQVQDSPGNFDGVLVGSPAWDHSHLAPWVGKLGSYQLPASKPDSEKLNTAVLFRLIHDHVLRRCDNLGDDPRDGIISNPEACDPALDQLLCEDGTTEGCLTSAQITIAKAMYSNYTIDNGSKFVFDRLAPGSELEWATFTTADLPSTFDVQYQLHFLNHSDPRNEPIADWSVYEDNIVPISERQDPASISAGRFAAMGAYRARGGKILMYHGLADGLIPVQSTDRFYEETRRSVAGSAGADITDFFRYFQVAGMQHCVNRPPGAAAPWYFGAAGQAWALAQSGNAAAAVAPGFDRPGNNALMALVDWVERTGGTGPDQFVATSFRDGGLNVYAQRPVCLYKRRPRYVGGELNVTSSWTCDL